MLWNNLRRSTCMALGKPERAAQAPRKASSAPGLTRLVDLPIEVVTQILAELSFESLLLLRLTSRAHDTLVRNDEILRLWLMLNVHPISLQLATPPRQCLWAYIMVQERCWHVAHRIAVQVMTYMVRIVLL